jgi:hypothetical protein
VLSFTGHARSYPVIYSAIVLPFSIVRWHELTHGATGLVSMLSTKAIWGLSGVLDVSVFLLTRPTALSFDQPSMYGGPPTSSFEVPSGDRLDEGGSVGNQMGDGVARSGA